MDQPATPISTRISRGWVIALGAVALYKVLYLAAYVELPFLQGPIGDSDVYLGQVLALENGQYSDPKLVAFSPLYGLFLHLSHGLYWPVFAVLLQFAFGITSIHLLGGIVQRHAPPSGRAFCCALYVSYGVLLYYESKVLSESFALFLICVGLVQYERLTRHPIAWRAVVAGVVFGLCTLARASFLFCLPPLVLAVLFFGGRWRLRVQTAVLLCLGMAIPLVANGLKTQAMTGHFIPVIAVSSTVSKTTAKEWKGLAALDQAHDAGAWDVVREAEALLKSTTPAPPPQIDWAGFFRGLPVKLVQSFDPAEHTYQYGYYGERSQITLLRILPGSFGFIALLGLLGVGLVAARRLPWALMLVAGPIVVGTLGMMCLFHPSSRYRLPMVLGLLIFASAACAWLWTQTRRQPGIRIGLTLVFLGLGAFEVTYSLRKPQDWQFTLGQSYSAAGDVLGARKTLQKAVHMAPDDHELRRRALKLLGERGATWLTPPPGFKSDGVDATVDPKSR